MAEAASISLPTRGQRAARDGAAAASEENDKRRRYPGPDLVPFVVEAGGRLGESAEALLRSVAPKDPEERQSVARNTFKETTPGPKPTLRIKARTITKEEDRHDPEVRGVKQQKDEASGGPAAPRRGVPAPATRRVRPTAVRGAHGRT